MQETRKRELRAKNGRNAPLFPAFLLSLFFFQRNAQVLLCLGQRRGDGDRLDADNEAALAGPRKCLARCARSGLPPEVFATSLPTCLRPATRRLPSQPNRSSRPGSAEIALPAAAPPSCSAQTAPRRSPAGQAGAGFPGKRCRACGTCF